MTATEQHPQHSNVHAMDGPIEPTVLPTDDQRDLRRLERLLDRRDRLARVAAERDAHDLHDAGEYQYELGVVEQAIAHCYPDVWEQMFVGWATRDAQRLHTADQPTQECGICRALELADEPPAAA